MKYRNEVSVQSINQSIMENRILDSNFYQTSLEQALDQPPFMLITSFLTASPQFQNSTVSSKFNKHAWILCLFLQHDANHPTSVPLTIIAKCCFNSCSKYKTILKIYNWMIFLTNLQCLQHITGSSQTCHAKNVIWGVSFQTFTR